MSEKKPMPRPLLHVAEILEWADAHYERTGQWPTTSSGRVVGPLDEKWGNLDNVLRQGLRGLRPGSSLARLLALHRGKRNRKQLPEYTTEKILMWADAYYQRRGGWPTMDSGAIEGAKGESWQAVQVALSNGLRGLPGGSSLARLLAAERGVRNRGALPKLSVRKILAWADAHRRRTGDWPTAESGPIVDAPEETWMAVNLALNHKSRGLKTRSSLFKLLARHRRMRRHRRKLPLTVAQILKWADAYHETTGRWPNENSGRIPQAEDETWSRVDGALRLGKRGLRRTSLSKILAKHRGARAKLTEAKVRRWAMAFYQREGRWPTRSSGVIPEAPCENWNAVNFALRKGHRGLKGGTSLSKLLRKDVRRRALRGAVLKHEG